MRRKDGGNEGRGAATQDRMAGKDDGNEEKTMTKQAIRLKIAGKPYPFTIESWKEEIYRVAEREVNAYLTEIKEKNIRNWSDIDYMAMAALHFAIANVHARQNREPKNDELSRLERLDAELDAYVNSVEE